jgi:hypothetical protein
MIENLQRSEQTTVDNDKKIWLIHTCNVHVELESNN